MEKRKPRPSCIALVGLPASGKSSIGSALARRLGLPFMDLDERIVASSGRSIAEIFRIEGESAFRRLESEFLAEASSSGPALIATGGGCVLSAGNRRLLRERCTVIWLDLKPEAAAARAGTESGTSPGKEYSGKSPGGLASAVRPLLAGGDLLERMRGLDAARRPLYRECADIVMQTEGKSPSDIVEELYAALD